MTMMFGREYFPEQMQNEKSGLNRSSRPEKAFYNHLSNNMWSSITNYGSVGDPNSSTSGRPSAQWPSGSGNNYLYDAGLWIGTMLGSEPAVTTYFYNPHQEYMPSPGNPGEVGNTVNGEKSKSLEDSYIVYDDNDSHPDSEHLPIGVKVIQRGLTWSLPDFDDFIAFEYSIINTGLNADLEDVYISFWYDIDVSSSDTDSPHIDDLVDYDGWDDQDSDTDISDFVDPYDLDEDGLKGYDEWGIPYGKDAPQNPNYDESKIEPDGFYDEWSLILDSDGPLINWQTDLNGGVPGEPAIIDGDTLKGYLFPRSLSYIYDGDNSTSSANDYGERENQTANDGFLGGGIIFSDAEPFTAEDGNSYYGAYSHQWWNWESDPLDSDQEKMDYMKGQHAASLGKRYLNNPLELGFSVFDYRFLLTTGPIDLPEGDTTDVVFILACGQGLEGLRQNIDNAYIAYYSGSKHSGPLNPSSFDEDVHWNLPIPPLTPELSYSPLNNGMRLAWDTGSESSWDVNLGRIDFEGYQIYRAVYDPQDWVMIRAFDNLTDSPVHIVNIYGDTLNQKDNNNTWILLDLPDIQNSIDDSTPFTTDWGTELDNPLNGLPYYYAISAYDGYKSEEEAGQELLPAYSPLTNYKKSVDGAPLPVFPTELYETGDAIPDLENVKVVPNPYRGTAIWEEEYQDKIKFINLPSVCKISIFSLAGDLIQEISHTDGSDNEYWDLVSRNNQSIVSGVYVFVIEAPDIQYVGETSTDLNKIIGKFVVFR